MSQWSTRRRINGDPPMRMVVFRDRVRISLDMRHNMKDAVLPDGKDLEHALEKAFAQVLRTSDGRSLAGIAEVEVENVTVKDPKAVEAARGRKIRLGVLIGVPMGAVLGPLIAWAATQIF